MTSPDRFIVLDVATTGPWPASDRIVEIGAASWARRGDGWEPTSTSFHAQPDGIADVAEAVADFVGGAAIASPRPFETRNFLINEWLRFDPLHVPEELVARWLDISKIVSLPDLSTSRGLRAAEAAGALLVDMAPAVDWATAEHHNTIATEGTPDWEALHGNHDAPPLVVSSSAVAGIARMNPWSSVYDAYLNALGLAERFEGNEKTDLGSELEPWVAERFGRVVGRQIRRGGVVLRSATLPWAIATNDYWQRRSGGHWGILEVKTTGDHMGMFWDNGAPPWVEAQMQWQMLVTGATWGSFAVLIGGQRWRWGDVERDESAIATLVASARDFLDTVTTRTPPPVDASRSAREMLHTMYPEHSPGATTVLPASMLKWDEQYQLACDDVRDAERRKLEAENQIKAAMGRAERATLPGGITYTWKTAEYKETVMPATTRRTLRRSKSGRR